MLSNFYIATVHKNSVWVEFRVVANVFNRMMDLNNNYENMKMI